MTISQELFDKMHECLLNATGTYNALETVIPNNMLANTLPGLIRCKEKLNKVIEEIKKLPG
mgnify:CR=1 FL=1